MSEKEKKDSGLIPKDGGVVVGGNVDRSNIVVGNNNVVTNQNNQLSPLFEKIIQALEKEGQLTNSEKEDVKGELKEIQTELEGQKPDESFLARRFRNIQRMAPDIVEVAMETLKNPLGGVAELIKKVAQKMKEDTK